MGIQVRYFAALRERMGRSEEIVDASGCGCVADVWLKVSGGTPLSRNLRTAVNQRYVASTHPVADGDEVAFFPPVTGG